MANPDRSFSADLARDLNKFTDRNTEATSVPPEDGSGPREIARTPEAPPEPELTQEERNTIIDQHIRQTEQFLQQSVANAEQAYKQVVERLSKNDIYSATFREAWDVMAAQQPYLASLEDYATKAVRDAGGTTEAAERMDAVRQKIADAEIALDEQIKLTGKAMIDGGFSTRYRPQKQEQMIATSDDETVKKWGSMIGKKELPPEKAISHETTQEQKPVAPKKKSWWQFWKK
jgi:hypothetical protein